MDGAVHDRRGAEILRPPVEPCRPTTPAHPRRGAPSGLTYRPGDGGRHLPPPLSRLLRKRLRTGSSVARCCSTAEAPPLDSCCWVLLQLILVQSVCAALISEAANQHKADSNVCGQATHLSPVPPHLLLPCINNSP